MASKIATSAASHGMRRPANSRKRVGLARLGMGVDLVALAWGRNRLNHYTRALRRGQVSATSTSFRRKPESRRGMHGLVALDTVLRRYDAYQRRAARTEAAAASGASTMLPRLSAHS